MNEQTIPPKDSTSDELEDQEIQAAKESNTNIEELNMVNMEFDHLMDLIADLPPEEQVESSKENTIIP